MTTRPTLAEDIGPLQRVLDETGLFPPDLLPEMLQGFLTQASDTLWLSIEADGEVAGFCFAEPEPLTNGTWNMRAIAVLPARQGLGLGGHLVAALERALALREQRILLADTSGTATFALTRDFYRGQGYLEAARIPDFWDAGDDKVVFWKALAR